MISWINIFYTSLVSTAFLLSVLGLSLTAMIPGIDQWSKRFFLRYFLAFMLCCLAGVAEAIVQYYPVSTKMYYFILVLESILLILPMPMLTTYLLHCSGESIYSSKLFLSVLSLMAVFLVELASSFFIKGFIYIKPDLKYYRGPWYPLVILPVIAILLLNLVGLAQRRKRLSRKIFLSFLAALLPMAIALFVQMFVEVFPLIDISFVLAALSMYSFILSDQIEQDRRNQQKIADQRANIMVLQMRPHFIYNTMTSIYCLCGQDPQLARQVIMDFTTYLRKNFTAIASSTTIPFSSELEHIRAYLAVEKALYDDSLFVDYDTPHTWFRVPPLTLQPIVENAVKHGRDPCAGPFHISIRTKKTDSGSEIIIADDGRGFIPFDDSEPHIALKNIQQRLEIMCSGHLTITQGDDGGTVVTITIPNV